MIKYFPKELKNLVGIKANSLQNIIYHENFRRGAMILSGGYAQQNVYSIMASKLYDIKQEGFCFWAHRYIKSSQGLENVSHFFECEGDKYLFMTYTYDKTYAGQDRLSIMEGESINHYYTRMWNTVKNDSEIFYVKEYKFYKNGNYNKYPDGMFPEIILNGDGNESGVAYLISEFSYLTESIELKDLCGFFKQYTQKDGLSPNCNFCNRPNHRLIELKEMPNLLLPDKIEETGGITYVIAKHKYPYIVQLKG